MSVTELAARPWRELVALLRLYHLPRRAHDTKFAMARRIAEHLRTGVRVDDHASLEVYDAILIRGAPEAVRLVTQRLESAKLLLATPAAIAVPRMQGSALRRVLRATGFGQLVRRLPPSRRRVDTRAPVELAAAGIFVRHVANILGWPAEAEDTGLPRLARLSSDTDEPAASDLASCWIGLLDAALDPDPEELETRTAAREPEPALLARTHQVLAQAITARQRVELRYRSARGVITRRLIEPLALQSRPEGTYLLAYCYLRQGERTFRLDRVEACQAAEAAPGEPAPP